MFDIYNQWMNKLHTTLVKKKEVGKFSWLSKAIIQCIFLLGYKYIITWLLYFKIYVELLEVECATLVGYVKV
jgi:hypothetical protein